MDVQPLHGLSALPRRFGRDRRIQWQVHVEPDGAAWRRGGDANQSYPYDLSQFLPPIGALGIFRLAPSRGCLMPGGAGFSFHDLAPGEESFRDAVLSGLSRAPKELPCKFFYDARG